MAVIRIEKNRNYTTMSNYHLRDKNLSLKGKGLLSVMLSLPEDWDYSVLGLEKICIETSGTINGIIQELEKNNYIQRKRIYENGKIKDWEYIIYEEPNLDVKNQHIEKQHIENLDVENCTQLNNNITNKLNNKETNNKILIKENKKENQQDTINSYNFSQSINEIINDWLTYKKEKGQTYKSIGLTKMLNSIAKGIKEFGEQAVIDSINKAMESNYAGFFIKGKTYQKPQQHQHLVIDHEQLDKDYAGFVGTYIGGDE